MKTILAAALSMLCLAAPVSAQDLTPDWSGFYFGVRGGGAWGEGYLRPYNTWSDLEFAGFAGVLAGFDKQFGRTVVGVDLSYNIGGPNGADFGDPIIQQFTEIRVRAGRTFGDWLLYGAAGASFGKLAFRDIPPRPGGFFTLDGCDSTGGVRRFETLCRGLTGWTAALGVERQLRGSLYIRGEIGHTQYTSAEGAFQAGLNAIPLDVFVRYTTVSIALTHRF